MLTALILLALLQQVPNLPTEYGTVEGVLRNAAGKPAAGVRVTAMMPPDPLDPLSSATSMASLAETDAEGRYRLERIPAGRYYISAGRVDLPTYYPGTTSLTGGNVITVTSGATVTGVNFVLKDESSGRLSTTMLFGFVQPGITFPVAISVDGGGPVPVFGFGSYPFLRFTDSNKRVQEIYFNQNSISVRVPPDVTPDEYKLSIQDLPEGYALKTVTYGSNDLSKDTLKVARQAFNVQQTQNGASAVSGIPISIVLSSVPGPASSRGVRVTGRSFGAGDEIYISGKPGLIFLDGTFEFRGVEPGLHSIVKFFGTTVAVAPVIVRDRDVAGANLQIPSILPSDIFTAEAKPVSGEAVSPVAMVSILGHVVDEISQETITEGAVTISGYGSTRKSFAIIADGGFTIPQLLPGTYNLTINVSGYSAATVAVTVGIEDLKLELKAKPQP